MNYKSACENLGLSNDESWNVEDLKRQYRRKALTYHPDKNRAHDAAEQFRVIQESYDFLLVETGYKDDDDEFSMDLGEEDPTFFGNTFSSPGYQNILFSFLTPILKSEVFQEIKSRVFYTIVEKITSKCEPKALKLLEKLDKKMLAKISDVLKQYRDIFHLSDDFLIRIDELFVKKTQHDECIVLNPFLEDLFDDNLYRLSEGGKTYLVPLWHNELIYDKAGGGDLYVHCNPMLPDNVEIDDKNNVHVKINSTVEELWKKDEIEVYLGNRRFSVARKQLKMTSSQVVVLANVGISKINTEDVYNVEKRADVYVHLEIV
jgi:DnaJ-class molecular chaperone